MTGAVITSLEENYVRALNAVLAAQDGDSADAHRWRGKAEAYRHAAELVREAAGCERADMTSDAWRKAHGVYQPGYLATLHMVVTR